MGLPAESPQVLAMGALKVATSVLVVLLVSPGAAVSPTQLATVEKDGIHHGPAVPDLAGRMG